MSITLAYQHSLQQEGELEMLIQGCSLNQRGAQNKLYEMFYPKMMALVRRYFPDLNEADVILNEGFLRAFKKIHTYSFKGSFEGWLKTIFRHAVTDYARRHLNYKSNVTLEEKDSFIEKDSVNGLYYKDLLAMVRELPATERLVFNLYAVEGYSHREIAKELGFKEGTSKWYLSIARKKLIEQIEKHKLR